MLASGMSFTGQVKGGGRLYSQSPLAGYTEEEMAAEAKRRNEHNRQRRRLKQLLGAASEDGTMVATKDLLLAAKLAKMELPSELVAETPYATSTDAVGVPTKIAWKPFYSSLPHPALKGPGGFSAAELPVLKKNRVVASGEEAVAEVKVAEVKKDEVAFNDPTRGLARWLCWLLAAGCCCC